MDTKVLAGAIVGFLLGGLTVSIAAELEDEPAPEPTHGIGLHGTPWPRPMAALLL